MAHALKFHAVVSGKTLALPDLSAFEGKRVEVIVMEEEGLPEVPPVPQGQRRLGFLRGRFVVPDDLMPRLHPISRPTSRVTARSREASHRHNSMG
jgi:hypothetical protein